MIGYEGAPRYTRLIEALTGDTEIVPPGLLLEVDRPEWAILKRERLWIAVFNLAAVAAQFNLFALVMPNADSIAVINFLWTDQQSRFGLIAQTGMTAGPGAAGGIKFRDVRRSGKPATQQFVKNQAAQQLSGANFTGQLNANLVLPIPPFVMAATTATQNLLFVIESAAVNVTQVVMAGGYERELRKEEVEM